jgi:hypothetical protein
MLPVGHLSTRGLGELGSAGGRSTRHTFFGGASMWNRTV